MKKKKSADTEVDAYVSIKEALKKLGWDVKNPELVPEGQVWNQSYVFHRSRIAHWI